MNAQQPLPIPTSIDPAPKTPPARAGVDTVWIAIECYDRDDYPPTVHRTLAGAKAAHPPPAGVEWRYWPARPGPSMPDRDSWSWESGARGLSVERLDVNP